MSRILLAVSRFEYGRPDWGDSFEYVNLFGSLQQLGHEVRLFDTLEPRRRSAPEVAGRDLLAAVDDFNPDLLFCLLSTDELPLEAVREAGRRTLTLNWFADDQWRFDSYSRHVAPSFHWVLTTSRRAEARYQRIAGVRPIFLPWGFNAEVFHPVGGPKRYDVSFVGQRYGRRGRLVDRLRAEGLSVYARGGHWPEGRVGWSEMASIFSASRVNLNTTESSAGPLTRRGWSFRGAFRIDRMLMPLFPPARQMKARIFEIAACGAFGISGPFDEVSECFAPGREIVLATSYREIRDAVVYYLEHEQERESIACAALERCLREHNYRQRFLDLFERIQVGDRQ